MAAKRTGHGRILGRVLGPAGLILAAASLPGFAMAQTTPSSDLVIVAPTPILGSGLDRNKAPVDVQVLTSSDLSKDGEPNVLRALEGQIAGVNLDSAAGNPYQPSLFYHGFEASPLQGTSEGLAVYVDGARFNQPFGDTVNWDLIPSLAIERLTVEDSNPLFGLNALGGSINTQLKTGFTYVGGEADLSGGSFGQAQADVQYGAALGDLGFYLAADGIHQDGWRDLQSSDIQNLYGDLGWRHDRAEAHLDLRLANSNLNGPGTSPVELLAADPRAQFTAPNTLKNSNAHIDLRGSYALTDTTSVQGVAYYDYFRQAVVNGNAANDTPCNDGSGLLCSDSGYSTTTGGATIPAFLGDSAYAYSELDAQTTLTHGHGGSGQVVNTDKLLGLDNHAVAGASYDGAQTTFDAAGYIGGLTPVTRVFVGPRVLIDEPGTNIPVLVGVSDEYYGVFGSDTLDLTPSIALTVSGRFNDAQIDLNDKLGGDLGGNHGYSRFNPAVGATWKTSAWLTFYGGYAEANRAPTPAELSCASPADSCSLANFFVADPNLKQVVSRTVEVGARGRMDAVFGGVLTYDVDFYRSNLENDIAFVNSVTLGRAYFTNVGATRRQGVDADVQFKTGLWSAYVAYSHTDATYQSGFVESGGSNPQADANGNLTIVSGDHLPGVPSDQVKLGVDVKATDRLSLGATVIARGATYLFGDEANLNPQLPGYAVLNLNGAYQLTPHLQIFARVENVANTTYYTYGTFSPTTSVYLAQAPSASNPRAYSPAAPVGGFGGVRLTF